ncbi:MAG: TIGR00730 family Rossman fold protein [Pseudomonadota bacterium]
MRICVFCGSSDGRLERYREAGRELGALLARAGIGVVYGGATIGVMGAVANGALAAGGEVIGVIPEAMTKVEIAHEGTDLRVVGTMHERKALMAELADAFIALPGGIGTMEEVFEVWTWAQLGYHRKPVGLLEIEGYWEALHRFVDHMVGEGFLREHHRQMLLIEDDAKVLLEQIRRYQAPGQDKLIDAHER